MYPVIDKASVSFRIGTPLWMPAERFRAVLELFEKYKGVTDEVTFFTASTHACLPLPVIRERAGLLAERMAQTRARGYRTGINLLSTIGHHNEDLSRALAGDYNPMTDIDGKSASERSGAGSICWLASCCSASLCKTKRLSVDPIVQSPDF